jgi:hypothetical protein
MAVVARGTVAGTTVNSAGVPATVKRSSPEFQQLQDLNLNLQNIQNNLR